ncbi:MAG: PQQ-dependent sugar dehydrogenase [Chloroflexi bacterium]|nr:PQQ-dependent sugar dehydrogenase [Chloroflexota bacterium]
MYPKQSLSPILPTEPAVTPQRRRFILAIGLAAIALAIVIGTLPFTQATHALEPPRKFNPADVRLADGYRLQAAFANLNAPTTALFDGDDFIVAESSSPARIIRIKPDGTVTPIVNRGLRGPVAGLALKDGALYVSHKGKVSVVDADGKLRDILTDLPSEGEHQNNHIAVGPDGKLYLAQGTITNAGVVGLDDYALGWLDLHPDLREIPCEDVPLLGQNYRTQNPFSQEPGSMVLTGAYEAFGIPTIIGATAKGNLKCGGSILRFNPDGSNLELVAWGLRNPVGLQFDRAGQLWVTSQGTEPRGSRSILNDPDYLVRIERGAWYGWPDYFDGRPVTDERFQVPGKSPPGFLWDAHPRLSQAFLTFAPQQATSGFAFSPGAAFGFEGDAFVAMAGPLAVADDSNPSGFRIARVDLVNRQAYDFATNAETGPAYRNSSGGFDHPADILFGPDGSMYVVDPGVPAVTAQGVKYAPGTGVIWRIYRPHP